MEEESPYKPLLVSDLQVGARHGGVDEETVPDYGMVAFRAGRAGGERGIRTLDGVAPKPHFQFAPEEGSEGLLGPAEVRCRCLEES